MGFWDSELGEVSGKAEDAFTKQFPVIPDNTLAIAQIVKCTNETGEYGDFINIDWLISGGEYEKHHVFQKLKVHDKEPKVRHKALNMLKLLFVMFHVKPENNEPPTDQLLAKLVNKSAGIKINEWQMTRPDGTLGHGNFVSEIHGTEGFICETGRYRDFPAPNHKDSALMRHPKGAVDILDDEIPF